MQTHLLNSVSIRTLLAVLSVGIFATNSAIAEHKHKHHRHHNHEYVYVQETYHEHSNYGRVLDADPIYQRVAIEVPQESCHVETVAREERRRGGDSFAGTVVGGLVGAAIGHEVGHGRGGATAVGGLIGATIGNDASRGSRVVSYRDREVCNTRYRTEYENRIVGYDVSYRYRGRILQTRTERHPGDRILISEVVRPSYNDRDYDE